MITTSSTVDWAILACLLAVQILATITADALKRGIVEKRGGVAIRPANTVRLVIVCAI